MLIRSLLLFFLITASHCEKDDTIVPASGYEWPDQDRSYWPTNGWQAASMEDHGIDPSKMDLADRFAAEDQLARALRVVKDG